MPDEKNRYVILYLEDDYGSFGTDLTKLRRPKSMRIYIADCCQKARELIDAADFDLFILDIEIKGSRESGIQFAEELRTSEKYAQTPIIFASMHSHYSSSLLSHIKNSAFLKKPFDLSALEDQICLMLNIPEYVKRYYSPDTIAVQTSGGVAFEIKPNAVSFIEAVGKDIVIQYQSGKTVCIAGQYGVFKSILSQIQSRGVDCLRQIHRSVIINVNQISRIELSKNVGQAYLFGDDTPKPIGIRYRENIAEFIGEEK